MLALEPTKQVRVRANVRTQSDTLSEKFTCMYVLKIHYILHTRITLQRLHLAQFAYEEGFFQPAAAICLHGK